MSAPRALALLACALVCMAASPLLAAADRARVVEATDLLARPDTGSRGVATLAVDTAVESLQRRGGWLEVRPLEGDDQRGWVRVWTVREAEAGEGLLGALKRFSRKVAGYFSDDPAARTSEGTYTATIGVRGLGGRGHRDRIGRAPPNPEALRAVRRHAVDPATARSFAEAGGLRPRPGIRTPGAGVSEAEDWDGW